jgi:hypothetical protein
MGRLSAVVLLFASTALAQMPFEGTWRVKMEQAQFSKKPIVISLEAGRFRCTTCAPKIDVKADGTDQPVSGAPWYDTVSATVAGDTSFKEVRKKDGKAVSTAEYAVSADKNTLTERFEAHPPGSAQPVTGTQTYSRVGQAPAKGNAVSGSWRIEKVENLSENAQTVTLKQTADGLEMSMPTGESYAAKFDGKDYPMKGDPSVSHIRLKKIDERTIEESGFHNGKPVYVATIKVTPNGKTITYAVDDKLRNRQNKFVAVKEKP